jgi:hypothetical protein
MDPATTFTLNSSAPRTPRQLSSLMPCTAKARSRVITKGLMRRRRHPEQCTAMIESLTRASSAVVLSNPEFSQTEFTVLGSGRGVGRTP